MRARKPWFRASKNAWYVEVDGKQVRLCVGAENEKAAFDAFYKLMATGSPKADPGLSVPALSDLFLEYSCKRHEASTYEIYRHYLNDFCKLYPRLTAIETKPFHITRWLDQRPQWDGSRWHAIAAVKRVFSWSEQEGLIGSNPIKHVKKPAIRRRERLVTAEEKLQILAAIKDQSFKNFVFAMQETGARPSEVANVTASDCNLKDGVWILRKHKTVKKVAKPRVIYLTPAMLELTEKLIATCPDGPLFRNTRGKAFTKNAIRCRFRRIRKNHPNLAGVVAYCYRHSFATNALVNGVGIAQISELLGHTSAVMVLKHYSHLAENIAHLRQAAVTATETKKS